MNRSKHQNYVFPHDEAAYRDYNPNWLLTNWADSPVSEPLVLETSRLRLVPIATADAEEWWGTIWSDLDVARYLPPQGILPLEAVRERIRIAMEHWATHGFGIWMLRETRSGSLVGHCGLLANEPSDPELVYALCRQVWGRGLATEAAAAVLAYAFDTHNFAQVSAYVIPQNTASSHVLRKLDFHAEDQVRRFRAHLDHFVLRQE